MRIIPSVSPRDEKGVRTRYSVTAGSVHTRCRAGASSAHRERRTRRGVTRTGKGFGLSWGDTGKTSFGLPGLTGRGILW